MFEPMALVTTPLSSNTTTLLSILNLARPSASGRNLSIEIWAISVDPANTKVLANAPCAAQST